MIFSRKKPMCEKHHSVLGQYTIGMLYIALTLIFNTLIPRGKKFVIPNKSSVFIANV